MLFGGNFSASWTFNYVPFVEPIASASITIGILDHDSAASGNQVNSFLVGGNDMTSALNTAFESAGGSNGEYNVYTLGLDSSVFASLDGSVTVSLALMGPGLQTALIGGAITETPSNGAHLIYSSLTVNPVPIPAAAPLFLSALAALGFIGRRRRRNEA